MLLNLLQVIIPLIFNFCKTVVFLRGKETRVLIHKLGEIRSRYVDSESDFPKVINKNKIMKTEHYNFRESTKEFTIIYFLTWDPQPRTKTLIEAYPNRDPPVGDHQNSLRAHLWNVLHGAGNGAQLLCPKTKISSKQDLHLHFKVNVNEFRIS